MYECYLDTLGTGMDNVVGEKVALLWKCEVGAVGDTLCMIILSPLRRHQRTTLFLLCKPLSLQPPNQHAKKHRVTKLLNATVDASPYYITGISSWLTCSHF